jgi:hypothetical protein
MSIMEPRGGQSMTPCAEMQPQVIDQRKSRQIRITIAIHATALAMMMRFLSLRSGDNVLCGTGTSARLCRRSAIMGASLEAFRKVDGSRIAAVSVFFSNVATTAAAVRLNHYQSSRCRGSLGFRLTKQRRDRHLLPVQRRTFIEKRTMDFVPRFSIMHGSRESRATH